MHLFGDEKSGLARLRWVGIVAAVLLLAFHSVPASAQENEDCLMCHEDPDLVGQHGDFEVSVFVDPEAFKASVHADFGCIDCHGDLDGVELPHEDDLEAADCTMCHDDIGEEYESGPHGAWAKDPLSPAAGCINCHGTHDVLASNNPASKVSVSNSNELCGRCHARELRDVGKSPHARQTDNGPAASCVSCHSGHALKPPQGEQEEVAICGTCHDQQAAEHGRSLHGRAAARGDALAPSCVSCHEHHAILPHSNLASPTSVVNIPLL
ncbi:MAG: cytochrome c3 family protein, partial [Acidobacteria bacterium]|nr:cytochrome c3 family protein [Candidatus Sulfomarinibacter kjeldsenii]